MVPTGGRFADGDDRPDPCYRRLRVVTPFPHFYIRFLGGHSWVITGSLAFCSPIAAFFFFEIALKKTLPKGFTEPLFYPLYDFFF